MGNGSQYHGIGAMHGIAKSSVCRQLHEVVAAICDDLFLREVCWPEPADRLRIAADFLRKGGFPSVGGCVDGTMVNIDSPSQHEEQYVNRHGNHALNVMAICGPNLQIYAASSRWPAGSLGTHRCTGSLNWRIGDHFLVQSSLVCMFLCTTYTGC
uniref:Nuclease HARBI1 n=1 Tax=Cacopsylla melanoneura TaxID=428564 RepID=A0A8D8RJB0_9HEMI